MDNRIGDILLEYGAITLAQLDAALELQRRWAAPIADILAAKGFVKPGAVADAFSKLYGIPVIDLLQHPPDSSLLEQGKIDAYLSAQIIPWRAENGVVTAAVVEPGPETLLQAQAMFGRDVALTLTTRLDLHWALQQAFEEAFTAVAVEALAEADPISSAKPTFTLPQLQMIAAIFCIIVVGVVNAPAFTIIALNLFMGVFFLGNFLFKTLLVWMGGREDAEAPFIPAQLQEMDDTTLPVYTILVPMFRDAHVLPILVAALKKLDYPLAKLDIKLVLEASDLETIEAARALDLPSIFEIIRVPPSQPQTKPKACNYALRFARGEYLVIYDAEDKPEPDQLKKTLLAFRRAPENTVCIQARLNYFNAEENWLTKMFTLDYSLWFDLMLPGLERLRVPIPLGGTSNHFKTAALRDLRAWDPYNVTEDADLGIRITQKGCRVGIVDSTTYEEANCAIPNWIRQRSRWLKGYMQTWLVHMRHPVRLYRSLGPVGFFGFQFFIGGTVLSALMNPIFWGMYIAWFTVPEASFSAVFPPAVFYMSLANLLIGNAAFIYLFLLAPLKRGLYHLVPVGLSVFFYWVLLSVAAYKGLWQLLRNPFYWEKTEHGISALSARELAAAQGAAA